MINKEILEAITNHPQMQGLSKSTIYDKIGKTRKQIGTWHSRRAAAAYFASGLGIDVHRILQDDPEQLEELQSIGTQVNVQRKIIGDNKAKKERTMVELNNRIIDAYGLPTNLVIQAEKMSKTYPYFYVFENLLRFIIVSTLEETYGKKWWNLATIGKKIRDKVSSRKKAEGKDRWVGKRGAHNIFYTNFGDLGLIITSNYNLFKDIFPSLGWIKQRIDDIEKSRNIIAHNNPLPKKEIERIKMYLHDLQEILRTDK